MVTLTYPRMTAELWQELTHFHPTEKNIASPDKPDSYNMMRPKVIFALDALRGLVGKPLRINSGYRTESHNKAVGGAPRSQHLLGNAADVSTTGWTHEQRRDFIIYARRLGFTGIGIGKTFIHVDMAPRTAAWIYVAGGQTTIPLTDEVKYA